MKKIKKKSIAEKVVIVEIIFIVGILGYLFFSTAPIQIFPLSGMTIIEPDLVFEIDNGEEIIISVDENFIDSFVLTLDSEITLPPGLYYWKVKSGFRESEIRNFTVKGHVGLNLKEKNETYELKNSGNLNLNITREKDGITTQIIIEVEESEEVDKDDSKYEGKQK